ncbi:MAG: exodeoxyribonuclease V subunit gamma, partial [Simkaniaceae bacterium]|nr:exodeoxyribonuclease V subunit gamma [Simkaniaceae bacterium]
DENSGDFSYDCRSLLESMQGDLVSMEENVWEGENRSVQMHSASSRRDEIEGVYKTLIHLAVEDPSFDPKQVKIYAPDISLYLPFIISRFGSSTSPFSFTVSGLPLSSESPFLKGFLHLLSLAKSRWTPPEVLALFHCRAFTERHDLNTSEVAQFKEWVYESRVRWGYEGEHRGTWHETLEKWVMSLAIQGEAFPLEMSDAPLIGKIFRLISSLHDDLQFFSQDRLIGDAVAFLRVVSEVYFMGDEEGSAALSQALKELSVLAVRFPEEKISFPVLYDYLSKVLSRKKGSIGGGGISFQSIQSGNFSPAQVVVVLGMDEESFPRREMPDHLSEIKKWVPSSGETDRFSLLEALFSARKTFILSHTSVDARDGKSVAASIFTRDLMETIEKKGSSVFKVVHPPLPFDQSYFSEDAYPKSYSVDDYTCAKMNYGVKKVLPRLIPDFYVKSVARSVLDETKQILTTDLTKLVRNPIQFYFNSQLGIYEREGAFFDAEGEFIPSPLDRYAVRQKALHRGWEEASKTEARMFPGGLFGDIAREKVSCEVDEYRLAMEKFEIDRDEIFSVQLSRSCRAPQKRGNVWILPAIETEKCVIHGLISDVTSRGLISYKKGRTADILARWADLVVWSQVRDCIDKEDCSLFFLGSGKKRDFSEDLGACALEQLLGYHEKAITEISPLHPLFFEGLFEPSVEAFQRYLEKSYGSLDFGFVDRYFSWLQKTQPQFEGSAIFEKWAPIAKDNFAVFHEWAMGGKR